MRSSRVVIIVALAAICGTFVVWFGEFPATSPPTRKTSVQGDPPPSTSARSAPPVENHQPAVAARAEPPLSGASVSRPLRIPPEMADFASWSPERQLNAITDIQRNAHLSPAMRDFLVDLASDPSRRSVLRNNAANALGIQDPPVPGWLGKLADQAVDPAETPIWRDYALQHLADQLVPRSDAQPARSDFIGSPDSGLDRQRYLAILTAVASSKQTAAGTALLHLDRLYREQGVAIHQAQFYALVRQVITDNAVDVGVRVTALGILGMRRDPSDADIPRRFLQDPNVALRRSAVAALGNLGTSEDIPAIEAVDVGGDPFVEMAKAAACKRLKARSPTKIP